jgi:uncharacterized protein (TIGR02246 family)
MDAEIRALYARLLERWNARDAKGMASLFAEAGSIVGFDGTPIDGRAVIESHLGQIFLMFPTPPYVGKVREVRALGADATLLRAVAGMTPPQLGDVNPALNAIQTMVAARQGGAWQIELFQNTPAAFHGRPQEVEALTRELREAFKSGG